MKKSTTSNARPKLIINRRTIRQLLAVDLSVPQGGLGGHSPVTDCVVPD